MTTQITPALALELAQTAFGPNAVVREMANPTAAGTRFRVGVNLKQADGTTKTETMGFGGSGYAEALQRAFVSDKGRAQIEATMTGDTSGIFYGMADKKDLNGDAILAAIVVDDAEGNGWRFEYPAGTSFDWLANHPAAMSEDDLISSETVPNALPVALGSNPVAQAPTAKSGTVKTPVASAAVAAATPAKRVTVPVGNVNPSTIKTGLLGWDDNVTPAAVLAAITGEHLLVVGPPGNAKSLFARRMFAHLEGTLFETQLSKYADETALFGAPNLKKLREEGVFEYPKHGIAANDWAFIDEIFDASDVLLRTLLAILQEKKFTKGGREEDIPLQSCIATANYTRVNEITAAVVDRFAFTVVSPTLTETQRAMLYGNDAFESVPAPKALVGLDQLKAMRTAAKSVIIPPSIVAALVSWAGEMGFTPRRERKMAAIIRANAALAGRKKVDETDIMAARYCVPISNSGKVEDATKSLQPLKDAIVQALHEGEQLVAISKLAGELPTPNLSDEREVIRAIKAGKVRIAELRSFKSVSEKVNQKREAAIQYHDTIMSNLHAHLGF